MSHAHDHARGPQRLTDVAVIGGSAAGLAAALQLARTRHDVIVLDGGDPRNAPAGAAHGYLGHEGVPPAKLTAIGRAEVRGYGVEVLDRRVVAVTGDIGDGFLVELEDGGAVAARRVVAATGLVDLLPDIEGLAAHWGGQVLHCPFCHGYEVRDRRVVQLVVHPLGLHVAPLLRQLTSQLTVVLHDGIDESSADVEALRSAGIDVIDRRARRVTEDADGGLTGVELDDGTALAADALLTGVRFRPRAEPFAPLGLAASPHETGLGDALVTDSTGATSVPGVYAAGNVTDPAAQLLHAAADGSRVGAHVAIDLAGDALAAERRAAPGERDWDARFSGEQVFSGNPNGTLLAEVGGLESGRALDVGAGEGADAIWLAEQGWDVTASDVSSAALRRIDAAATKRGVRVRCLHADANGDDPYGTAAYDLVSAQYAVIPRTPDDRGIRQLLDAVAPGGTLLFVHHDHDAHRREHDHAPLFDPEAYVQPADVAAAIGRSPDFVLETDAARPRPTGHATIDVPDVVVRARRRSEPPVR
ncbi:MAG: FAD-dependent oxidoreductase [Actinomycetota bacterium]